MAPEVGTRALLDGIATGDPNETLRLGELFQGLGDRAFGMLLMAATAPAFIPIPGLAGALSGPLVMLVGIQLLVRLRQPWLPGFLARRSPYSRRELRVSVVAGLLLPVLLLMAAFEWAARRWAGIDIQAEDAGLRTEQRVLDQLRDAGLLAYWAHPEATDDWFTDSGLPVPRPLGLDLAEDLVRRLLDCPTGASAR